VILLKGKAVDFNYLEPLLFIIYPQKQMAWQRKQNYGRRNYSELAIQRYKRILGNQMQSREFKNQKQEAMVGCGVLNKMTSLDMPVSYRM
jgi:hypothetical protein